MVEIKAAKQVRSRRSPGVRSGRSRDAGETGAVRRAARTGPSWKAFTAAVASALTVLEDGQFLILVRKRTNDFVQFAGFGRRRVRAEAVSNNYLKGRARLDAKRIARLRKMGWNDASGSTADVPAGGSPNFFRDCAGPVRSAAVAELAVATLRQVFGVKRPSDLEYRAAAVKRDGILLPALGIARDRKAGKGESAQAEPPAHLRVPSRDLLAAEVALALATIRGGERVVKDEDGDFALRTGNTVLYVRVGVDTPAVRIFSTVATGLHPVPALLDTLNEYHRRFYYVRFQAEGDSVVAVLDLFCRNFVREDFLAAARCVREVAEEVGPELESRFGRKAVRPARAALADANRAAGRATAAWLTGEGLAAATEKLRTRDGEDPIPAPLLDQWRRMLVEAATEAVQAADDVLDHANGERRLRRERLAALVDRSASRAAEAERSCRALARLALGVTSHTEGRAETARLERAAVLVLSGSGVRVEEEGVVFLGRERSELVTEAAGLLCWMLTQQRCGLAIGPTRTGRLALDVVVDDASNLLIRKDGEEETWGAPVTVIEPARVIADFLSDHREAPLDA